MRATRCEDEIFGTGTSFGLHPSPIGGKLTAMARLARTIVPGVADHVTQRGNNRQDVFFVANDRRAISRAARECDGIPDFADGYDRDATPANDDDTCTGLQFVPIVLQLSKPQTAYMSQARITITYNSSDPANVQYADGEYTITDAGILRLWRKDGSQQRDINPANDAVTPGDFIPGCGGQVYTAAQLGFTENLTQTFFVEAVRPSTTVADQQMKVEVDWDGEGTEWVATEDAVRVTAIPVNILGDTNRDGIVDAQDEHNKCQPVLYREASGALVLANTDSDCGAPVRDCDDEIVNGTDDLEDMVILKIRKLGITTLPPQLTVELSVTKPEGDTYQIPAKDRVRVFDCAAADATAILGPGAGDTVDFTAGGEHDANILAGTGDPVEFAIEGIEYGVEVVMTMKVKLGASLVAQDAVRLLVSPFLVVSNLGDLQRAFVVRVAGANDSFVEDFKNLVTQPVTEVSGADYGNLLFVQDCMEIGYSRAAAAGGNGFREMHVILDVVMPDPLSALPRDLNDHNKFPEGLNYGYVRPLAGPLTGAEEGGNIEASPPNETYRAGRVIVGSGMNAELKAFFARQKAQGQNPLEVDTTWLHIGHIDEILSFAQVVEGDPPEPKTKMLIAAPQDGGAKWEQAGGAWGELVALTIEEWFQTFELDIQKVPQDIRQLTVKQYNEMLWDDHLASVENSLPAPIGMGSEDVIRIPVILIPHPDSGRPGVHDFPNRANLFVREPSAFVIGDVPEPVFDPIKVLIYQRLHNSVDDFVDSYQYYLNAGDVHCGTNAARSGPEVKEWQEE